MRSRISAAVALVAALAETSSAQAYELKHAPGGALVRWRHTTVAWTIDRTVKEVPGAEDAIRSALEAWSMRGGGPALVVAATDAALEPGFDGKSAIFYAKDGFAPAGAALAVTLLSFDDRTGEVLEADIVLNGRYPIGVIDAAGPATDPGADTYDVGRIIAHEMGHALGLSDELTRPDALMYPYVARARAFTTTPESDDLAGLATLYSNSAESGARHGANASGGGHRGCGGAVGAAIGAAIGPRGRVLRHRIDDRGARAGATRWPPRRSGRRCRDVARRALSQ